MGFFFYFVYIFSTLFSVNKIITELLESELFSRPIVHQGKVPSQNHRKVSTILSAICLKKSQIKHKSSDAIDCWKLIQPITVNSSNIEVSVFCSVLDLSVIKQSDPYFIQNPIHSHKPQHYQKFRNIPQNT